MEQEKKTLHFIITETWRILKTYRFSIASENDNKWEQMKAEQDALSKKFKRHSPEERFCNALIFAISNYISDKKYEGVNK